MGGLSEPYNEFTWFVTQNPAGFCGCHSHTSTLSHNLLIYFGKAIGLETQHYSLMLDRSSAFVLSSSGRNSLRSLYQYTSIIRKFEAYSYKNFKELMLMRPRRAALPLYLAWANSVASLALWVRLTTELFFWTNLDTAGLKGDESWNFPVTQTLETRVKQSVD